VTQVASVEDPDDEFEMYNAGITFFGVPGASGWADKIGDVAIHYMTAKWAVFSKIFPFAEQADAREAHEDVLLLGSTRHVMLTPCCAYRLGVGGLRVASSALTTLRGDGGRGNLDRRETTVGRAPKPLLHRLYLTWAHEDSDFRLETAGLSAPDLEALQATRENFGEHSKRIVGVLFRNFVSGGKPPVPEQWLRYPSAPLDPSYYQQLLATAASMTESEQRARAMMEPRATPREGVGDEDRHTVKVSIPQVEDSAPVPGMWPWSTVQQV
jgi:hypothetical protein